MSVLIQDKEALFSSCVGNIPLLLSAPHGGSTDISNISGRRTTFTITTPGCGFNQSTDTRTKELTQKIVERMASQGVVPYAVISDINRADLDLNRARTENVYLPTVSDVDVNRALELYDEYYGRLRSHIQDIQLVFGSALFDRALLIDIHGAGFSHGDLDLTTTSQLGSASTLIDIVYPNISRSMNLWDALRGEGFTFRNAAGQANETRPSCNLLETFGVHQNDGINAVQIEFNSSLRSTGNYEDTANRFADALVTFTNAVYTDLGQETDNWATLFLSPS